MDGMTMLAERERCEKNLYFKEFMKRIEEEHGACRFDIANGITLDDKWVRFYQGKFASFHRVLLIPDEIIEDCKPKEETKEMEETGEPSI
jgi:hypothetical protein